jgi:hypothetical protein
MLNPLQPQTVTVAEIQSITRLGRNAVQNLFKRGVLPNFGNSKRFLTSRAALTRYLEGSQ